MISEQNQAATYFINSHNSITPGLHFIVPKIWWDSFIEKNHNTLSLADISVPETHPCNILEPYDIVQFSDQVELMPPKKLLSLYQMPKVFISSLFSDSFASFSLNASIEDQVGFLTNLPYPCKESINNAWVSDKIAINTAKQKDQRWVVVNRDLYKKINQKYQETDQIKYQEKDQDQEKRGFVFFVDVNDTQKNLQKGFIVKRQQYFKSLLIQKFQTYIFAGYIYYTSSPTIQMLTQQFISLFQTRYKNEPSNKYLYLDESLYYKSQEGWFDEHNSNLSLKFDQVSFNRIDTLREGYLISVGCFNQNKRNSFDPSQWIDLYHNKGGRKQFKPEIIGGYAGFKNIQQNEQKKQINLIGSNSTTSQTPDYLTEQKRIIFENPHNGQFRIKKPLWQSTILYESQQNLKVKSSKALLNYIYIPTSNPIQMLETHHIATLSLPKSKNHSKTIIQSKSNKIVKNPFLQQVQKEQIEQQLPLNSTRQLEQMAFVALHGLSLKNMPQRSRYSEKVQVSMDSEEQKTRKYEMEENESSQIE